MKRCLSGCGLVTGLLICFLCSVVLEASGQEDSIALHEVQVNGTFPERYMAGIYVQRVDSAMLRQLALGRLDEVLSAATPLIFRNYGNGQLSSIGFRGLSSNHTAVMWNGVNINLPSVGQTDFSTLSAGSFEKLTIQYGAGATQLGTDAVGGGISLESVPLRRKGIRTMVGAAYDHFRNWSALAQARYRYSLNKEWTFEGKTQLSTMQVPNEYLRTEFKGRRLEHSATHQKALIQDFFFENKKGRQVSAHLWVNDNEMTLWPNIVPARELTGIRNVRTMLKYGDGKWSIRGAYIRDILDYATGDYSSMDHATTSRSSLKADRQWIGRWKGFDWSLTPGTEVTYLGARVSGYEVSRVNQMRGEVFLLSRWGHSSGIIASMNLRQAWAEGYSVPFTPSVGVEYPLIKLGKYQLIASASVARSYRVPTLNERYWKDLGNPDIKPESGFNKEFGLSQTVRGERIEWSTRVNLYHNKVDDWVYWNPGRIYKAENLQLVIARGGELINRLSVTGVRWKVGLQSTAAYTRSTQERAYDSYSQDVLGKQLRFTPVWVSANQVSVRVNRSQITLQHHFESKQYITFDNRQFHPSYQLFHLMLEQEFRLGGLNLELQGRVSNLTNQLYLNAKSYAMPGRGYQIRLLIDY